MGEIAPNVEFQNYAPCEGNDERQAPPTKQRPATVLLLLQVRFPQENVSYSARCASTKKTLSNMKAKNTIKITYLPGSQLCTIKMITSKQQKKKRPDAIARIHRITVTAK
jgi:hypothetical protein